MKKFSLSLVAIFLAMATLSSCSSPAKKTGVDTSKDTADSVTTQTELTAATELKPDLPERDYKGEEFHFLVENGGAAQYQSREIYAEQETGELINDAVFRRNMRVEEQFNVKITQTRDDNVTTKAKKSLQAGDTQYDVVMPYLNNGIPLAQEGLLMDLNTVPYLELSHPWWDQRANENLEVNNRLFFTTGDISTLDNDCTMVMFFNKKLVEEHNLDNPYDLVKNNKWTLDKMYEMTNNVTRDLNGDGKLDNQDFWGLFVANNAPHSFFFGSGERIVKYNKSGEMELVMNNARSVEVLDKVFKIAFDKNSLTHQVKGADSFEKVCAMFNNSQLMFVTFALVDITFLRDAKFDFGILPYPLYDENQKEYNHLISTGLVPATCVPYNSVDPERAGILLESLAYHSVDTLTAAYYDNALNTRYIRDEESSDMLDIIFSTRVYDLGYIFNWGGLGSMIEGMHTRRSSDFASQYAKLETKALAAMQKTMDAFDAIK